MTRFLRRRGIEVVEVNRPDRRSRRVRGRSDPLDAEGAARRALAGEDRITPKDTTTIVEAIRVLRIARTGAVKARTAAYNQLKDLIITAPDSLRDSLRGKTLQRVASECARLRPNLSRLADPSQASRRRFAASPFGLAISVPRSPSWTPTFRNWSAPPPHVR